MRWSRLIFRDKFTVNAEYAEMAAYFKRRLGENYFKGYIDEHQTQLFCYWAYMPRRQVTPPVCQMNFNNEKNTEGKIVVRFKIVNALVILLAIVAGVIFYELLSADIPVILAGIAPLAAYLYLAFSYYVDSSGLMNDIREIESYHSSQKLR